MRSKVLVASFFVATACLLPSAQADSKLRSSRIVAADQQAVFPMEWRRDLVRSGVHRTVGFSAGRPCVSVRHRMVVVGTGESNLVGLSADDGEEVWVKNFDAEFDAFCTLATLGDGREVALASSRDGTFRAVTVLDGLQIWGTPFSGESRSVPVVTEEGILVSTVTNELALLDVESGKVRWKQQRPAPNGMTVQGHATPVVHGGVVYTGFSDGYVAAYRLESGDQVWSRPLSISAGRFGDVDASPVIVGDRLVVASYAVGLFGLALETGETRWQQPIENVTQLAFSRDVLLAGTGDGVVIRINANTGTEEHRTTMPGGPLSSFVMERGLAIFGAGENGLIVLDARTGKPMQATALKGEAPSAPSYSSLGLFVLGSRGDIYKFKVPSAGL